MTPLQETIGKASRSFGFSFLPGIFGLPGINLGFGFGIFGFGVGVIVIAVEAARVVPSPHHSLLMD